MCPESDHVQGAIVTLRNRDDINDLGDLVNARIATRTIASIADFGMHWREMVIAGVDPMMTSRQVLEEHNPPRKDGSCRGL